MKRKFYAIMLSIALLLASCTDRPTLPHEVAAHDIAELVQSELSLSGVVVSDRGGDGGERFVTGIVENLGDLESYAVFVDYSDVEKFAFAIFTFANDATAEWMKTEITTRKLCESYNIERCDNIVVCETPDSGVVESVWKILSSVD